MSVEHEEISGRPITRSRDWHKILRTISKWAFTNLSVTLWISSIVVPPCKPTGTPDDHCYTMKFYLLIKLTSLYNLSFSPSF